MGGVLAADDIARAVSFAYQQPQNVCIREIALAPTKQQPWSQSITHIFVKIK